VETKYIWSKFLYPILLSSYFDNIDSFKLIFKSALAEASNGSIFYSILLKLNFITMAIITDELANTKKGKENPPSAYKAEPMTGPDKYPNAWKNSAMAIF
jgi:hypothetical protein